MSGPHAFSASNAAATQDTAATPKRNHRDADLHAISLKSKTPWSGRQRGGLKSPKSEERITREGPLSVAAFEQKTSTGGFWAWTPEKAALEYLWRTGELAVHRRDGFQKVYDLSERVYPELHARAAPPPDEHLAWAATTAAARLVIFTPTELAHYWDAISLTQARTWCAGAVRAGGTSIPSVLS